MELNKVNTPHYRDYGTWIRQQFPFRVQKISVDAGFSCPNRDGRISTGGCIYCDNRTFNPSYCQRHQSITAQLEAGKQFFARKYPDMKYLAHQYLCPAPSVADPLPGGPQRTRYRRHRDRHAP